MLADSHGCSKQVSLQTGLPWPVWKLQPLDILIKNDKYLQDHSMATPLLPATITAIYWQMHTIAGRAQSFIGQR